MSACPACGSTEKTRFFSEISTGCETCGLMQEVTTLNLKFLAARLSSKALVSPVPVTPVVRRMLKLKAAHPERTLDDLLRQVAWEFQPSVLKQLFKSLRRSA